MPPPTILAHKTDFLTSQTLQLSRALSPSNTWRASNTNHNHNKRRNGNENENDANNANPPPLPPLPEKAIDDALYRLNHALQQHARRVYAPQATRHVAEQVEALYLEAGERGVRAADSEDEDDDEDGGAGDVVGGGGGRIADEGKRLRVGVDFTTDETILSLPPTWSQHPHMPSRALAQAESHPPEAQRYADLAAQLAALSTRRKEARDRVARLRNMHALLAPFRDSDDGDGNGVDENGDGATTTAGVVQPNLVTRNGEVEKELERMRFLLVRVAGRVARLPPPPPSSLEQTSQGPGKQRQRQDGTRKRKGRDEEEVVGGDRQEVMDVQDLDTLERRKVERLLDGL